MALINSGKMMKTITLAYASKLGLKIRHINLRVKKIDDSTFETFEIIFTSFQIENKLERAWFF